MRKYCAYIYLSTLMVQLKHLETSEMCLMKIEAIFSGSLPQSTSYSTSSIASSRDSSVASPNSGSSSQFFVSSQKNFASLYEKLLWQHQYDEASQKDVTLGRRVGFYKFKSELGSGNFSKVKLAIHQITKGKIKC